MAEAIQDVIGRDVQLAYGRRLRPVSSTIMFVPAGKAISSGDFEKINARIADIVKEDRPFSRYEESGEKGLERLRREGTSTRWTTRSAP
jgi:threonyl-tRNA synthetase